MRKLNFIKYKLHMVYNTYSIKKIETRYNGVEFKQYIHVSELGLDPTNCNSYEASPPYITKVLSRLHITEKDSILDLGCGKGFSMYIMGGYPFGIVDGLDISKRLCIKAKRNLDIIYPNDKRFHIYTCNARFFFEWDKYNYFYMYNPFKGDIVCKVLESIKESLSRNPRRVILIYCNPVFDQIVVDSKIFTNKTYKNNCSTYFS